jgi:hypothetical protein
MSKWDFARVLDLMSDDGLRSNLAAEDFSDLAELTLTAEERQLLVAAAADYPETSGFGNAGFASAGLTSFTQLLEPSGGDTVLISFEQGSPDRPIVIGRIYGAHPGFAAAVRYIRRS